MVQEKFNHHARKSIDPDDNGEANKEVSQQTRMLLLGLLFVVQLIYFPINRWVTGGVVLEIPIDAFVPLWPWWVAPYLLGLFWWAVCFTWAAIKMNADLYRSLIISALFIMLTSYLFFVLYPTYVIRPELTGSGWANDLLLKLYANDKVNNAFPSGHTYTSVLILLYWWRWKPDWRWVWLAITVMIILSTLFTGQHNILDPIGGILWAWVGYRLGILWVADKVGEIG